MDLYEVDRPTGGQQEPFFFLTHGAGGDLSSGGLRAMSGALVESGHLSVRANLAYRAAGRKSPPAAEKSVPGFMETFERVKADVGPNSRWVAGGRSYGGRVASMAACDGLAVAGLIFFPYPLHRPGDPAHPRAEHWPRITSPCLFIQGTKDPFCDIDVLEKLLPTVGGRSSLLLVEGGRHSLEVRGDKSTGVPPKSEKEVIAEVMPGIAAWVDGI